MPTLIDRPTMDEAIYAESWENKKYDSHGEIRLQVNEIFRELLLASPPTARTFTLDVYFSLLPFIHRYLYLRDDDDAEKKDAEKKDAEKKDDLETEAVKKAREISRKYILTTTKRVDVDPASGEIFQVWQRALENLNDQEQKCVLLFTGNFVQTENGVRPLTIDEIATDLSTTPEKLDSVIKNATDKIRNFLSQRLIYRGTSVNDESYDD